MCHYIIVLLRDDVPELLRHLAFAAWLGSGGPGLKTYLHVARRCRLGKYKCPEEAMLPKLSARDADLAPMYKHLKRLFKPKRLGRDGVLSGDGRCAKMRFTKSRASRW